MGRARTRRNHKHEPELHRGGGEPVPVLVASALGVCLWSWSQTHTAGPGVRAAEGGSGEGGAGAARASHTRRRACHNLNCQLVAALLASSKEQMPLPMWGSILRMTTLRFRKASHFSQIPQLDRAELGFRTGPVDSWSNLLNPAKLQPPKWAGKEGRGIYSTGLETWSLEPGFLGS